MDRELPTDFGRRLKAARHFAGMSKAEQLAAAVGVHPRSIKNWEAASRSDAGGPALPRRSETPDLIARISEATKMPEVFLWGDWPTPDGQTPSGHAMLNRELRAELLIRVAEASRQIEEVGTAISQLPPAQQR